MAYTFRLHRGTDAQNDGWQKSEELKKGSDENTGINSIEDQIEGGNVGKIGTSIPTPFARIYLFETAFAFVSSKKGRREPNFYDQLVTQSLDLLQLIFEKGKDSKLKLYEWNGEAQKNILKESRIREGHKALAESLSMAMHGNPNLRRIILVEYDGILLGGTSPMTLTFTSPNAIRLLEGRDPLLTNDKKTLFRRNHVLHLQERSVEFQKYVYWLVKNHVVFQEDNSPLIYFYTYFKSQNLPEFTEEELNGLDRYYPELSRQTAGKVDVRLSVYKDLMLRFNDAPILMESSDFLMRPSITCYGNGPVPVVLPTDGDAAYDGWQYTKNERWNLMTMVEYYQIENERLEDRRLPVNGANNSLSTNKYPWLTTDDFFTKSIVCLGFNLNRKHFYFPSVQKKEEAQFLLPIKKEYFKYFTLADLQENLSCEVVLNDRNIPKEVTFRLKIKLKNKPYIILGRRYVATTRNEEEFRIVDSKGLSFGVFPFYRCQDEEDRKNEYSIYLYGNSTDPKYAGLHFHRQDSWENKLTDILLHDRDFEREDKGVVRTSTNTGYSKVYNLRNEKGNSFDFIEVTVNEGEKLSGLAIPMWPELPGIDNNKKAIISVDFGTSNTYVSYLEDGKAKPLSIGEDDQQMVLLNDYSKLHGSDRMQFRNAKDFGEAQYMPQYMREFLPSIIGNEKIVTKEELVEYPIKTATIEKQNFTPTQELFSGISIGFNIDNETTSVDAGHFRYVTNLKWNAEENKANQGNPQKEEEYNRDKARIKAFCDQTLWMIKNKLVMRGFSTEGEFMYFYPDSMSETGREIFKEAWEKSVAEIFTKRGFKIDVKEELEAISPYYSLLTLHNQAVYGKSTANIDVGGGTTDYFILDLSPKNFSFKVDGAESGKAYEASVFFAGNDLWGATYPFKPSQNQENGFVSYMKDRVKYCERKEEAMALYKYYDASKGVADFSGFFFKNDDIFKFSDKIASNKKFKFVVFLHYAGIIHHFAEILKIIKASDENFEYPEVLSFTGKGSEYVNMITKDINAFSKITTDLIKAFGVVGFKQIRIIRVDNPKALTADGGIYEMMNREDLTIHLFDKDKFGAEKSTSLTNTPYERIGKRCIGLPPRKDGFPYMKSEITNLKENVMEEFESFLKTIFYSQELNDIRKYLQFDINEDDFELAMKLADDSYDTYASRLLNTNVAAGDDELTENVFFFALKNTLINLSNTYYENQKIK